MEWIRKHWLAAFALLIGAAVIGLLFTLPGMESASLAQMSGVSLAVSLMRFGVAAVALFLLLRLLDYAMDMDIGPMSDRIEHDALASAIYLGLRFLALAWLAAACVG